VLRVRRDSRGLRWFCTYGGLSRFDGVRFVSFGIQEGLPYQVINDVFEDREKRLWIATNGGGIARFRPDVGGAEGSPAVESARLADDRAANRVNVMHQDASGALWLGTDAGLFLASDADRMRFTPVPLGLDTPDRLIGIFGLASTPNGDLWAATTQGLIRRNSLGHTQLHIFDFPGASPRRRSVLADRSGLVWVGGSTGLVVLRPGSFQSKAVRIETAACRFSPGGAFAAPDSACRMTTADGLTANTVVSLHELDNGEIAIGTSDGLMTIDRKGLHVLVSAPSHDVEWMVPDGDTGFWLSTRSSGVLLAARNGFHAVGSHPGEVRRLFLDEASRVYAVGRNWTTSRIDPGGVVSVRPDLPASLEKSPWENVVLRDRLGSWWMATGQGVLRFPAVPLERLRHMKPSAVYDSRSGLPGDQITLLYEDSRGDVWIGMRSASGEVLTRWLRESGAFQRFSADSALPRFNAVTSAVEDKTGQVWFGFREGGLARFANGRFTFFGAPEGVPGPVRTLYVDPAGRLWCGTYVGVLRVDDPSAAALSPRLYTTDQGLSSSQIYAFTSDRVGRLYIGYEQGVDRLDPESGAVAHFGQLDGVPPGVVHAALADRDGAIWIGTGRGLARMMPGPEQIPAPPRVLVASVRAAGVPFAMSQLGVATLAGPRVDSGHRLLEIEFFGLAARLGERLRFEYRLDEGDWSGPTYRRHVTYASLPAGRHRLDARAINPVGLRSAEHASVSFEVVRPFWQRSWFLSLAGLAIAGIVSAAYRFRVAQLLRVERIRARIATDLHDDIGASLSQISMLAEVVKYRSGIADQAISGQLSTIAATSRSLVDDMADIVWAINPSRDSLNGLIHRMRRFAQDTLGAADIQLTFRAPDDRRDRRVGANLRREALLILKESVNNIARHSGATAAEVELGVEGRSLRLSVSDNGRGFDTVRAHDGNGLDSMRKRVAALGGTLQIASSPGRGTAVRLAVDAC
jgi:signal transduction histidine kinase/ligand-binding sensor domain-containing protein